VFTHFPDRPGLLEALEIMGTWDDYHARFNVALGGMAAPDRDGGQIFDCLPFLPDPCLFAILEPVHFTGCHMAARTPGQRIEYFVILYPNVAPPTAVPVAVYRLFLPSARRFLRLVRGLKTHLTPPFPKKDSKKSSLR
jgi:hypothetical protein